MYADDLVIYCKANVEEARVVADYLHRYFTWTGQEINWHKSSVHFNRNVTVRDKGEICDTMGIRECSHRSKYLGHPFCKFQSKSEAYRKVVEKLANKLTGWKQRVLSMVGRVVLIKSIAQAIPSFIMQTVMLPRGFLSKMDKSIRDFYWGIKESHSHNMYLKSWSTICLLKPIGGLGLRSMTDMNQSLFMKLA